MTEESMQALTLKQEKPCPIFCNYSITLVIESSLKFWAKNSAFTNFKMPFLKRVDNLWTRSRIFLKASAVYQVNWSEYRYSDSHSGVQLPFSLPYGERKSNRTFCGMCDTVDAKPTFQI